MTQPQPRYQPGDKIGGRYQVHQALMGGMGEVYLCLDLETIHPYALKTFQQRYLTNPKLRATFENEVATWVALEKHPNIVRCFWMEFLDNQPFVLLEWVVGEKGKGTDLRSWLRRGSIDLQLALDFTINICRGLIHAQQKQPGIVHRDLKPENILIAQGRLIKITDFGLAQIVQTAELEVTGEESETSGRQHLSNTGGTPPYMAPEQWRGEALDARTDIYALGCIVYEMLTGRWPFQATTVEGLRHQHLKAGIPQLANGHSQTLPCALDTLLTRCLAKRRKERFATLDDLLEQVTIIYRQQFAEPPKAIVSSNDFTAIDYNNRGNTYAALQQYDKALTDFNRAIRLNPNYALAYNNRGLTYADLQRYEEALADFNRAIQLDPTDTKTYNNRGNTYAKLQRYEVALADFNQAIQLDPTNATAYNGRGLTYENLQQYDEALADLNQSIQLDPNYATTYTNRGVIYRNLQRYDEALADYNRAIQLDPANAKAYNNRGSTYENLQRYDEALADFSQAIQLAPNLVEIYTNRGNTYSNLQRYEEALGDYTRVIQFDPTNASAFTDRGNAYFRLHRYDEALADYNQAIKLDPNYAIVYTNIGAVLANQNKLHQALPYFEKAAQLGLSQGTRYMTRIKQMLGIDAAAPASSAQLALEAFQEADSFSEIRRVGTEFPFMINADAITALEQYLQQLSPEDQPAFGQRLAWLRQIADEQKREKRDQ